MEVNAGVVVGFWREAGPERWFARSDAFDARCGALFLEAHFRAARREHDGWMDSAEGALALVLLLDQIPRNVFRGSAHAYATDPLARHFAARAIDAGFDTAVDTRVDMRIDQALRVFLYLPFEHAEDLADQHRSLALHRGLPGDDADRWARLHLEIIERFGRFPHRNAALGRDTTVEEQAFLDGGGFAG